VLTTFKETSPDILLRSQSLQRFAEKVILGGGEDLVSESILNETIFAAGLGI
jgi:hypothetical protein